MHPIDLEWLSGGLAMVNPRCLKVEDNMITAAVHG